MNRLLRLPVLRIFTLSLLTQWCGTASALGLGAIHVQSSLGQRLSAEIPIIGNDASDLTSTCIQARLQSADGVPIGNAMVSVLHAPRGDVILLSTRQAIGEPAILVDVNVACGPVVHRDFSILLDPVGSIPVIADSPARSLTGSDTVLRLPDTLPPPRRRNRVARVSNSTNATISDRNQGSGLPLGRADPPEIIAAPPSTINTAVSPGPAALKQPTRKKNVLKLSNEGFTDAELAAMGHLKISTNMSDPVLPMNIEQRAGLIAARNLFAQLIRGEDVAQTGQAGILRQIDMLQNEITVINRQRASDRVVLQELKKNSLPMRWVFILLGLLLLCAIAAGLLAWRMRTWKKLASSPWDVTLANQGLMQRGDVPAAGGRADAGSVSAAGLTAVYASAVNAKRPSIIATNGPLSSPTNPAQKVQKVGTDFGHNPSAATIAATLGAKVADRSVPPDDSKRHDMPFTFSDAEVSGIQPVNNIDRQEAMHFYSSRVEHLKVEEISDVMQEADFWMSLNDPQRAIEILEPYAAHDLPDSPMPWLYLLDLYRGTDEQLKYTELQERAARIFNVRIALWDEDADLMESRTLEDYPHIAEQICALWKTNDISAYLENLIFDRRDGARAGFDLSVYQEIMMLLTMVRTYGDDRPDNPLQDAEKNRVAM